MRGLLLCLADVQDLLSLIEAQFEARSGNLY
jgi:hypothetical protein